jgi:hypothetical protein
MKTVVAFLKSMKWVAWIILALGVGILFWFLRGLFDGPGPTGKGEDGSYLPPVPKKVQDKVDKAEEDALTTKAGNKATTDAERGELDVIRKIPDGKERRKRLAAWVRAH